MRLVTDSIERKVLTMTEFKVGDIVRLRNPSSLDVTFRGDLRVTGVDTSGSSRAMVYNEDGYPAWIATERLIISSNRNSPPNDSQPLSENPEVKRMIEEAVETAVRAALAKPESLENYTVPDGHVLVLRTSMVVVPGDPFNESISMSATSLQPHHKIVSYHDNTFEWPREFGAEVVCNTYSPSKTCGNGLHGLKWGYGDHGYLSYCESAIWQIVEVDENEMVEIGDAKVKFRTGRMIYTGDLAGASMVLERFSPVVKENMEAIARVTGLDRRVYNKDFAPGLDYSDSSPVEVGIGPFSNVIGSRLKNSEEHAPALDLDVPAFMVESSTPGHSHLFIDVKMSWRKYKKLLKVLGECGILEEGYVKASIARQGSFLRLPWIKKLPAAEKTSAF